MGQRGGMNGLPGKLRAGDPGLEARTRMLLSSDVQRAPVRANYIEEVPAIVNAFSGPESFFLL